VRLRAFGVSFVIALAAACGGDSPMQPAPLTDCAILGVIAPSNLGVGETRRLSAYLEHCRPMFLPLDPSSVTWTSLDSAIASLSGDTITGAGQGPAIVQATFGHMTQQALVLVGAALSPPGAGAPARIRIYGCPGMAANQRGAFGALAIMPDGTVSRVSSAVTWQSSNPRVAGVSEIAGGTDRSVDAFTAGSTTITATYQGVSGSLLVQVQAN
jgi:hypothetical protein